MACEKMMACCVRGYHVYKDIWAAAIGEVLVCSRERTNEGKIFVAKLYSCKLFSVYENILTTKKRITVISLQHTTLLVLFGSSIQ